MDQNKKPISDEEYFKIDRLSNSMMKHFARSPRHYLYALRNPTPPTPAMIFGSLFHTFLLEPDLFEERYVAFPVGAPRRPSITQLNAKKPSEETIQAIDFWDRFDNKHLGKQIVLPEDMENVLRMKEAVDNNNAANELLLSMTETEKALLWEDDITGIAMKGKMDANNPDITIDLKSCENAHPEIFARSAYDWGYDRQAALYLDGRGRNGMKKGEFYFIAVEKSAPYGVSVNKASRDFIEQGRYRYGKILEDFAHWQIKGSPEVDYPWTANPFGYHELHLPPWVK